MKSPRYGQKCPDRTETRVEDLVIPVKSKIERIYGADIAQNVAARVERTLREIESKGELDLIREVFVDKLLDCVDINFKYASGSNLNKGAESTKLPLSIPISEKK